jgi:hypothetical protein
MQVYRQSTPHSLWRCTIYFSVPNIADKSTVRVIRTRTTLFDSTSARSCLHDGFIK